MEVKDDRGFHEEYVGDYKSKATAYVCVDLFICHFIKKY